MSNKHYVKRLRRLARAAGKGRIGHQLSGALAEHIRKMDDDAARIASVRPQDKARAEAAAARARKETRKDDELARLVKQDARRRQSSARKARPSES